MDVIFFPRNDYPNNIEVCTHRFGKTMTYTEQSDGFRDGAESIVSYAVSKNIKVGVFWAMSTGTDYRDLALPYVNNGKMWIDAYCHPSGAGSGDNVTAEAYYAQRDALYQRLSEWFNVKPNTISYSYGDYSYSELAKNDFLAGRNSGRNGGTTYGIGFGTPNDIAYSKDNYIVKQSTSRWYDDAKGDSSFSTRLQQLATDVNNTKQNHGWYNNFTHWHNVISDGNLQEYKDYIDLLETLNQNDDIHFAGYGEAVAYLVYRQIITKAVMYTPVKNSNQLVIRLETVNNVEVSPDLLTVPISIKFSTTGTPLENKTITSVCNLITLGNNNYIVEIPFSRFPKAIVETQGN